MKMTVMTCAVVGLMAGVRDLGTQLQIVPRFVSGGTVGPQSEHAAGEAGQVTHLPLQVPVLPLANKRKAAAGLTDEVTFNGLGREERRTEEPSA